VSRYYRNSFGSIGPGGISPTVKTLIIICCIIFVVQLIDGISGSPTFTSKFGLVPYQVTHKFYLWQPVTYIFLHGGFLHIIFNMLGLWMFGTEMERLWGKKTFTKFFFICGVGGALFKTLLNPMSMGNTIGASGAILGILVAYAFIFPERVIILYIFPIKVKWFVIGTAIITVFSSLQDGGSTDYRVHLGGMLCAVFYMRGGGFLTGFRSHYDRWQRNRLRRKFEVYYNERHRDENPPQKWRRWRN
jgi:membrane associated rhomboid family serine protease